MNVVQLVVKSIFVLTGNLVWAAGAAPPEVVGPDDVGSPVVALVLLLAGVALVCVGVWLALVGLAAAVSLGLIITGIASISAVVATGRGRSWAGRAGVFLRVATGSSGLLGGAGLGSLAHVLWPHRLPLNWALLSGAAAGLGAGLLGATITLLLLKNGWKWFEKWLENRIITQ